MSRDAGLPWGASRGLGLRGSGARLAWLRGGGRHGGQGSGLRLAGLRAGGRNSVSEGKRGNGQRDSRRQGHGRRENGQPQVVPRAEFGSYYGRPVIKEPVWKSPDVPGYLFLGGLAGASSALAAAAQVARDERLARAAKVGAAGAISLSAAALIHDLGRPARFVNMLRVFKTTSPMSVGSWLLAAYGPAAGTAALSAVTGRLPRLGRAATAGAAVLGPAVATYTAALLSDTAVPAWHEGHREMPYVFAGSAATAAGGLGLLAVPPAQAGPALRLAVLGAVTELTAKSVLVRRLGPVARAYQSGRAGALLEAGEVLTACGLAAVALGGRSRALAGIGGASLLAASALTRFGIFDAGRSSALDPSATVGPQRQRVSERERSQAPAGHPGTPGEG